LLGISHVIGPAGTFNRAGPVAYLPSPDQKTELFIIRALTPGNSGKLYVGIAETRLSDASASALSKSTDYSRLCFGGVIFVDLLA